MISVLYAFTLSNYDQARGTSPEVYNASIAFVDEDGSTLSGKIMEAFYPPRFQRPELLGAGDVDDAMEAGRFMFVVEIPPLYERDPRAGRRAEVPVNIDVEIAVAEVWSNAVVVRWWLRGPIAGSPALFLAGVTL